MGRVARGGGGTLERYTHRTVGGAGSGERVRLADGQDRRTLLAAAHVAGPLHPMTLFVWGVFALIALADALPRI